MSAVAFDFEDVVPTVMRAHSKASRDDAEEAVQTAVAEGIEKGWDLTARNVVACARFRLLSAKKRREAGNLSLEAFAEDDGERAPVELAVSDVDYDSHAHLAEARVDPIMRRRLESVEAGGSRQIQRRGAAHHLTRYSGEQVDEARRLHREHDLPFAEIARRVGCSATTAAGWVKGRYRLADTRGWEREDVIAAFTRHAERTGAAPKAKELNADPSMPCLKTVVRLFGSFNGAVEAAGLPVRSWGGGPGPAIRHTRETLDAAFLAFVERHGRWPRCRDIGARGGLASKKTLRRVYGTYSLKEIRRMVEA